jgi:large subunit ribosomal protein L34e
MKTRRSRSYRRIMVKVPGGTTRLVYKQRKPDRAKCSGCEDLLKGMSSMLHSKVKNTAKTKKRPQRPYGGVLCSKCMRKLLVSKFRSELT